MVFVIAAPLFERLIVMVSFVHAALSALRLASYSLVPIICSGHRLELQLLLELGALYLERPAEYLVSYCFQRQTSRKQFAVNFVELSGGFRSIIIAMVILHFV